MTTSSSGQPPSPVPGSVSAGKDSGRETEDKILTMECGAAISKGEMGRFVQSFQQSTRRWELVVYPAMFAFVVLAGYGFFLIYSLTGDMRQIARSMDANMGRDMSVMSESVQAMSENIKNLTQQINIMRSTMDDISVKMDSLPPMATHVGSIDQSVARMDQSVRFMTGNTDQMRADMGTMNRNISRPMSFFNNFAPW